MEMFTGTFLLLGLGLAGIMVGVIDVLYPISLNTQLTIWIILSLLSIALWFKYMKDNSIEHLGQSNYSLETLGVIEESIRANGRGKVRFDMPVLGNTIWTATAKEDLSTNSRVKIVEIKGQLIEVAKI
ncbi:Putative activity regulator of membrane protease YbbK [hydrothermal vent metagenome]|uniref:Putative activity regulator of membrane protease YbbK n=1 Tax=hydrothermal vent metagenome TaxID=652676 RepID=A0A1W1CR86_9ZZZZ